MNNLLKEFANLSERYCINVKLASTPLGLDVTNHLEVCMFAYSEIERIITECRVKKYIVPITEGGVLLDVPTENDFSAVVVDDRRRQVREYNERKVLQITEDIKSKEKELMRLHNESSDIHIRIMTESNTLEKWRSMESKQTDRAAEALI